MNQNNYDILKFFFFNLLAARGYVRGIFLKFKYLKDSLTKLQQLQSNFNEKKEKKVEKLF